MVLAGRTAAAAGTGGVAAGRGVAAGWGGAAAAVGGYAAEQFRKGTKRGDERLAAAAAGTGAGGAPRQELGPGAGEEGESKA